MEIKSITDPYALYQDGSRSLTANWDAGSYDIKALSFSIGDNKLTTTEWAFLDGQNQAVKTTDSPTFVGLTLSGAIATPTNITASGTIQAEQLTSTDDITMQGHLFTLGNGTANDIVLSFSCLNNSSTLTYDESEDEFNFNGSDVYVGGKLGVGISPTYKLHVDGAANNIIAEIAGSNSADLVATILRHTSTENTGNQLGLNWVLQTERPGPNPYRTAFTFSVRFNDITDDGAGGGTRNTEVLFQGANNGSFGTLASFDGDAFDVVGDFTAGTIQADDGYTGTWVNNEGNTVTVVGGIITDVS